VIESLPKGIKWTAIYYLDNILSEIAALWDAGSHRKMIVHADNAGPHAAKCVTEYTDHNSLKRAPHPPYSPDLTPSDFYLFGDVKHQL
jgi:transposase